MNAVRPRGNSPRDGTASHRKRSRRAGAWRRSTISPRSHANSQRDRIVSLEARRARHRAALLPGRLPASIPGPKTAPTADCFEPAASMDRSRALDVLHCSSAPAIAQLKQRRRHAAVDRRRCRNRWRWHVRSWRSPGSASSGRPARCRDRSATRPARNRGPGHDAAIDSASLRPALVIERTGELRMRRRAGRASVEAQARDVRRGATEFASLEQGRTEQSSEPS